MTIASRLLPRTLLLSTGLGLAAGCSWMGTMTGPARSCPETVDLQVRGTARPTFAWHPNCGVFELQVYRGGSAVWGINSLPGRSITSPVVYGTTPEGAQTRTGPEALRPGEEHVVIISEPGAGQSLRVVARTPFTP